MIKSLNEFNTNKEGLGGGKKNYYFNANQRYCSIGSNLILTGLLKISRQESLSSTRFFFKNVFLVKLINNSQYFIFPLLIQKIQLKCNFCFMLPTLCFNKMTQIVVVLAAWILHLSTLGDMLLQGLFKGELNFCYIFKNMATQSGLNLQLQLCLTNKVTKVRSALGTRSHNLGKKSVFMPLVILVTMFYCCS